MDERVAITIFGMHAQHWMDAVGPGASVWSSIPSVCSVRVLEPSADPVRLAPNFDEGRPVLIPLMESHIRQRPKGYFIFGPNDLALETFANKAKFARFVEQHRLSSHTPKVYDAIEKAAFPLLVKPAVQNSGNGIRLFHDIQDYNAYQSHLEHGDREVVLQEFISENSDYSTYAVCRDGKIIWNLSFEFDIDAASPIRGAVVAPGRRYDLDRAHIAQIERFLSPVRYSGPCNVDYKITADGGLRVLEINPRLGGSLMLPEHVEELRQVLQLLIEESVLDD